MQETENASFPFSRNHSDDFELDTEKKSNKTNFPSVIFLDPTETVLIAVPLGLIILFTVIGNTFVIYAISTEKNLKRKTYKLIMSLAFADLMVALLVMPISLYNEIYKNVWNLSTEVCELWIFLNVMFCSASILHLLAIAINRYWTVTNVEYSINPSHFRIYILIGSAWTVASLFSAGPVLGWKDARFYERLATEHDCFIPKDIGFTVFSSLILFHSPLVAIVILYWKIFRQAKNRIRKKRGALQPAKIVKFTKNKERSEGESDEDAVCRLPDLRVPKKELPKESVEDKRERRAAKVLIVVTGGFVCFWSPFSAVFLLKNLFSTFNQVAYGVVLWLAYSNSLVNPILYTVFIPDFRNAYRKIIDGLKAR